MVMPGRRVPMRHFLGLGTLELAKPWEAGATANIKSDPIASDHGQRGEKQPALMRCYQPTHAYSMSVNRSK
jgi:hypothetical protein